MKGINSYYNRKINEFRAIHIPLQSECTDYNDYLSKIREAAIARCGAESGDSIRYAARALRVVLNNNDTQHKLISDYQDALRISIENYREALQKMVYHDESRDEITDDYYETLLYPHSLGKSVPLDNYSYQLEKLRYLNTAVYADDMTTDLVDDFNEEKVRLGIRDCYALMKKRDKLGNEFHLYLSALDGKYHFNNSEWARIQVRILIPLLKPYMNTPDIFLKNIELYT